jgi:hypothetical protein
MHKLICLLLMLLMMSGCCEVFGLCTSVNVHTSASSPDKYASSNLHDDFNQMSLWAPVESNVRPANVILGTPDYLPPN